MLLIGFGDSITAGVHLPAEETYLHLLGAEYGLQTLNSGKPGDTSRDGIARLERDVLNHRPEFCIISFGMNDHCAVEAGVAKVGFAEYAANLRAMVDACRNIGCCVILCTIHPVILGDKQHYYYARHNCEWYINPSGADAWIRSYSQAVRRISAETGAALADIEFHFYDFVERGGDLNDILRTTANCDDDDGVHLTRRGHNLYMKCIEEPLRHCMESANGGGTSNN